MSAAAGLEVDVADAHEAEAAGAARGLDRQGADQFGIGVEDALVDPLAGNRVVGSDQCGEAGLECFLGGGFGEVEVEAGPIGANLATGDGGAG